MKYDRMIARLIDADMTAPVEWFYYDTAIVAVHPEIGPAVITLRVDTFRDIKPPIGNPFVHYVGGNAEQTETIRQSDWVLIAPDQTERFIKALAAGGRKLKGYVRCQQCGEYKSVPRTNKQPTCARHNSTKVEGSSKDVDILNDLEF